MCVRLISAEGIALIKSFEKCKLKAYLDGGGVPTLGWGSTGPDIKIGMEWTQQQADDAFTQKLTEVCGAVTSCTPGRAVTQPQFDAFVSFAYNVGVNAFRQSTMLKRFMAGQDCTPEFCRWVLDNGKVEAGLVIRRMAERQLFRGKDWRAIQ